MFVIMFKKKYFLAGHEPPHMPRDKVNYFVVTDKTTPNECVAAFRKFATRHDVVRASKRSVRAAI